MDEYENLVVAVAMIDAAIRALEEAENQDQVVEYLHETRNRLNDDRIVCLGNGRGRPFWAADRIEELEVRHANDCEEIAKWREIVSGRTIGENFEVVWRERLKRSEAKLAKAVCALHEIAGKKTYADDPWGIARTTLAELKGQDQ